MLRTTVLALPLLLAACVYVPVVNENDSASSTCQTYTKALALSTIEMQENFAFDCGGNADICSAELAAVVGVTAGSAIISGSIVLTGNTLHWLEYQGTCSDGYLARAKRSFLASISQLTGHEPEHDSKKEKTKLIKPESVATKKQGCPCF